MPDMSNENIKSDVSSMLEEQLADSEKFVESVTSDHAANVEGLAALLPSNTEETPVSDNNAFAITPLDYNPEEEAKQAEEKQFTENLERWKQQVISKGVPESIAEEAVNSATMETCKSYSDFTKLIDKASSSDPEPEDDAIDEAILIKSVEKEIKTKLSGIKDIRGHLADLILRQYNTTAAGVEDLLYQAENDPDYADDLKLNIYKEPIYSLILQYDQPWVEYLVEEVKASWEDNDAVNNIVDNYIDSLGGPKTEGDYASEYESLVQHLPNTIRNENSPYMYKVFRAVLILTRDKTDPYMEEEFADKLLENAVAMDDYVVELDTNMDEGLPYEVAAIDASEVAAENLSDEDKKHFNIISGASSGIGTAAGWFLNIRDNSAKAFGESLRSTIGDEQYEAYMAEREKRREQNEEKHIARIALHEAAKEARYAQKVEEKQLKHAQRMEEKQHKYALREAERERELEEARNPELRIEREKQEAELERIQAQNEQQTQQSQYVPNQQQNAYGYNQQQQPSGGLFGRFGNRRNQQYQYQNQNGYYGNQGRYGNQGYYGRNVHNGDFAPKIPGWILATGANIFIGLVVWLAYGKQAAIFSAIGLVISVVGFLKQKHQEHNAMLTILCGYAIVVLAIFLSSMK